MQGLASAVDFAADVHLCYVPPTIIIARLPITLYTKKHLVQEGFAINTLVAVPWFIWHRSRKNTTTF